MAMLNNQRVKTINLKQKSCRVHQHQPRQPRHWASPQPDTQDHDRSSRGTIRYSDKEEKPQIKCRN
jgi:hypothetical protein